MTTRIGSPVASTGIASPDEAGHAERLLLQAMRMQPGRGKKQHKEASPTGHYYSARSPAEEAFGRDASAGLHHMRTSHKEEHPETVPCRKQAAQVAKGNQATLHLRGAL